jgi:hypothetical protein
VAPGPADPTGATCTESRKPYIVLQQISSKFAGMATRGFAPCRPLSSELQTRVLSACQLLNGCVNRYLPFGELY